MAVNFGSVGFFPFVCIWQCLSFSKVIISDTASLSIVNTTYGPVKGQTILLPNNKTVNYFLGIPYAKAKRFEPPTKPDSWNMTRNATAYGKVCPQPIIPSYINLTLDDLNEDCHFINVFIPVMNSSERAPLAVMFYVHAGGYSLGAASRLAPELPSLLATEGNVIVVTFNYRVGVLGFLASATAELKGNYGLLDQVQALEWVQHNIKSFGGDPSRVTVFGLSSGGMSTSLLMLSPLTRGLFQRAITQSGQATGIYAWLEQSEAEDISRDFSDKIGCPELPNLQDCLKDKTLKEINDAQLMIKERLGLPATGPVIDGQVLPDEPKNLLREGNFSRNISVISGIAKEDGSVFFIAFPDESHNLPTEGNFSRNVSVNTTKDEKILFTEFPVFKPTAISGLKQGVNRSTFLEVVRNTTWVRNQTDAVEETIIHEYTDWSNPDDSEINRAQLLDLATDAAFRAPLIQTADYFAQYDVVSYVYQLEFGPKDLYPWQGVQHGEDFKYIFGYPLLNSSASPNDTNPTPGNTSQPWPVYATQGRQYLALKPDTEVKAKMRPEKSDTTTGQRTVNYEAWKLR